ncbi:DUF6420 family protein [Streptomyces sp. NPDC059861]|uniref:DUF6420 family protein n=1 Tax=Streptomyces sp. NPDC059861 TaxID=3346974 RepID=UPI00364FDC9F
MGRSRSQCSAPSVPDPSAFSASAKDGVLRIFEVRTGSIALALRIFEVRTGSIALAAFVRAALAVELGDFAPADRLLQEKEGLAGPARRREENQAGGG